MTYQLVVTIVPIASDPLKVAAQARDLVDDIEAAFAAACLPSAG